MAEAKQKQMFHKVIPLDEDPGLASLLFQYNPLVIFLLVREGCGFCAGFDKTVQAALDNLGGLDVPVVMLDIGKNRKYSAATPTIRVQDKNDNVIGPQLVGNRPASDVRDWFGVVTGKGSKE